MVSNVKEFKSNVEVIVKLYDENSEEIEKDKKDNGEVLYSPLICNLARKNERDSKFSGTETFYTKGKRVYEIELKSNWNLDSLDEVNKLLEQQLAFSASSSEIFGSYTTPKYPSCYFTVLPDINSMQETFKHTISLIDIDKFIIFYKNYGVVIVETNGLDSGLECHLFELSISKIDTSVVKAEVNKFLHSSIIKGIHNYNWNDYVTKAVWKPGHYKFSPIDVAARIIVEATSYGVSSTSIDTIFDNFHISMKKVVIMNQVNGRETLIVPYKGIDKNFTRLGDMSFVTLASYVSLLNEALSKNYDDDMKDTNLILSSKIGKHYYEPSSSSSSDDDSDSFDMESGSSSGGEDNFDMISF